MNIMVNLTQTELSTLNYLAAKDRRSLEAVAEILLRSAIAEWKTIETFRERVDLLPVYQGAPATNSGQKLGIIDTIVEILKEAKEQKKPLSIDEIHQLVVQRCGSGSRQTVTAQLSRLPRERNLKIATHRVGKSVKFSAE